MAMRGTDLEKSRVSRICDGYARGGAVAAKPMRDPGAMKANIKRPAPIKKALGEMEGEASVPRLDKFNRGGAVGNGKKGGAKTTVNVVVAPQGGGDKPPMPMPPPMMPPPAAAAAPPPRPPGPPLGPAGAMPPGLGPRPFKRGGAVKVPAKRTDGAGGGLGRLEKIKMQKGRK